MMPAVGICCQIELSRRNRLLHGATLVGREIRSPAQGKITGTIKPAKAMKSLDASEATSDDAVLR